MKTLRKIVPFMLLLASAFTTSGCSMYSSKADEKKYFIGTYVLDEYKAKHSADEQDPYDRKADEGIVAYFTVTNEGYGYYGYKSNTKEARVYPIYSTFVADEEEEGLFKAIVMKDGVSDVRDPQRVVGCGDEPTLGFKRFEKVVQDRPWPLADKKEMVCTLAWTIPHYVNPFNKKEEIQYSYACYKKVSDDASLAKLNELMGTSYTATKPYELGKMSGFAYYCWNAKDPSTYEAPYEYAVIDYDSYSSGKYTLYYSEKSNPGKKSTQVPVTITAPGSFKVTWNNRDFLASGTVEALPNALNADYASYTEEDVLTAEWFSNYYGQATTVNEVIEEITAPQGVSYIKHRDGGKLAEFAVMEDDTLTNSATHTGLELKANEEFVIYSRFTYTWSYFEDLVGDAGGKIVQGSVGGKKWYMDQDGEIDVHYLKATEAGTYDISVDQEGKVTVTQQ